ncbi:MAG: S41 family peptidase [Cyclobacteriaceae bacterium]|nr:S41 family peptidase [Cyclobacteriaceae bacterium]
MKRLRRIVLVCGVLAGSLFLLALTPPGERYFEIAKNLEIFASLFKEVNALYVDEINPNKLARTGIDAMLGSLDPYTNYIAEDEIEDFRMVSNLEYGGIGAVTRQLGKRTVVSMVYDGYPAARSGLKIGDEIIEIDGVDLRKISSDEAGLLQRGPTGSTITLTIQRPGVSEPLKIPFKREQIKINNVPYSGMVGDRVGYVLLSDFSPNAGMEVKKAIVDLKAKGATRIVLDLRNNLGGLLNEAVNICNLFLPKGKLVVEMKGKVKDNNHVYETSTAPLDMDIPVAVLINRHSASASEIVAGTLQDYDRAVIIGERSFGKGLVQTNYPVSYRGQVKVTIAKYYTPTGRCIQALDYSKRRADGSVSSVPDSIKKAYQTAHKRTVYDGGGIAPDVQVASAAQPTITQVLQAKGLLFDYATAYALQHPTIAMASAFELTDGEYKDFLDWIKSKEVPYQSPVDTRIQQLIHQTEKEPAQKELKLALELLRAKTQEVAKGDLIRQKQSIKRALEQEITSRYYSERGMIESSFRYDNELKEALVVLSNDARIKKILGL